MPKDYELAYVDSQIARLRLRRELISERRMADSLRKRVDELWAALNEEERRTTPDSSVFELTDLTLTRKLSEAQELVRSLRERASKAEKDAAAERLRRDEATEATGRAIDARNQLALEVTDRINRMVVAERQRIAAWLRSVTSDGTEVDQAVSAQRFANMIEKGLPS